MTKNNNMSTEKKEDFRWSDIPPPEFEENGPPEKKPREKKPKAPGVTAKLVKDAFDFYGLQIKGNGSIYDKCNRLVENPRDFVETYHDSHPIECEKSYFDSQIRNLVKEKREQERTRLIDSLAVYKFDGNLNLKMFCQEMLYGTDFTSAEGKKSLQLFEWGISSAIMQMKRKMKGLRIFDHKVVVFIGCGTEGDQKTEAIKMLLSPLECLANTTTVAEINDWSRNYPRFVEHYGLLCDELSNAKNAEPETVKMVLTADTLSPRKLGKQQIITVPNNSTTMATSNLPICEIFKENSSVRRFLELFVTVNPKRYLTLKDIDYVALFKSVKFDFTQEEIEDYLDNMRELIVPVQKESVFKDIFEEFLEENKIETGTDKIYASQLHQEMILYIDYKRYKIKYPSVQSFGRTLNKRYGMISYRDPDRRGNVYYINGSQFTENCKRNQTQILRY